LDKSGVSVNVADGLGVTVFLGVAERGAIVFVKALVATNEAVGVGRVASVVQEANKTAVNIVTKA
jgi:hypothetical protein